MILFWLRMVKAGSSIGAFPLRQTQTYPIADQMSLFDKVRVQRPMSAGHRRQLSAAELALSPAADHQPPLEMGAERRVIIGKEPVVVAVVDNVRLRSDRSSDGGYRLF